MTSGARYMRAQINSIFEDCANVTAPPKSRMQIEVDVRTFCIEVQPMVHKAQTIATHTLVWKTPDSSISCTVTASVLRIPMLSGLMSVWMMPRECRSAPSVNQRNRDRNTSLDSHATPRMIWFVISQIWMGGSGARLPSPLMTSHKVVWHNSKTVQWNPLSTPLSRTLAKSLHTELVGTATERCYLRYVRAAPALQDFVHPLFMVNVEM